MTKGTTGVIKAPQTNFPNLAPQGPRPKLCSQEWEKGNMGTKEARQETFVPSGVFQEKEQQHLVAEIETLQKEVS